MMLAKYWKTAMMAATGYLGESLLFLFDYVIRLARVVVLLAIWRILLADRAPVDGFSLTMVLTYTLIAEVFASQLNPETGLDTAFWQGTIVGRLLQPLPIFGLFSAEALGKWLFELCFFSLPLLLLAPFLGVTPWPVSLAAGGLFLISLFLGIMVGLAVDFIFGALLVILALPLWSMLQIRRAVTTLLSGALIPLALLPAGVGAVFAWLPFASIASAPLQIYVGAGAAFELIALQAGWAVILWPVAGWLWQRSRERMIAYGG